MRAFRELTVRRLVKRLSGRAVTVELEVPVPLKETYQWRAGQHLSIEVEVAGKSYRRSYSLSESPQADAPLEFTVKRVPSGLVSNHLNDHLEVGQSLKVMPPFGSFHLTPRPVHQRTHYFFAAGSGITPIYSMLRTALELEPHSRCHLLFANRGHESVLFRDRLERLGQRHGKRLTIHHLWSQPSWNSPKPWRTGRLDGKILEAFLEVCPPYAQDTQYYICGPGSMNSTVHSSLRALDVPGGRIHSESFGSAALPQSTAEGVDASAKLQIGGRVHSLNIKRGETVLQAARQAGLPIPYSCESGVCGACKAKLQSGEVHMKARMALDDSEVEAGDILTCQAVVMTTELALEF